MEILDLIVQLAPILSFITIIITIIFGIIQLKQFKIQRKNLAAAEIMRTTQDAVFTDSLNLINKSEFIENVAYVRKFDPELEKAILAITTKFEILGFLVFKKVVPIEFVEQLIGGVCVTLWKKLHHYIEDYRILNDQKLFLEWFEWLAFQFKDRKRDESLPAIEKIKKWNS